MERKNFCYAQSGGVTAVINATAGAVIQAAGKAGRVYAGKNGIMGILREELVEVWRETPAAIAALAHTPGGAFGSCRTKLPNPQADIAPYQRLSEVFAAHGIGYFLYNGGNDSADTTQKIAAAFRTLGDNTRCIGVPKTIDNDLPMTDCCPGFGSAAKYVAVSTAETMLDVAAMARTSTKVFILEVMGRHSGWLAAAGGLAAEADGPVLLVFPEVPLNAPAFLAAVKKRVRAHGYAVVVASEGARREDGELLSAAGGTDAFSHRQLGGVAPLLADLIGRELSYKTHWAVADYLQRAARHIASATDLRHAQMVGKAAVALALAGKTAVMPVLWRLSDSPGKWDVGEAPLKKIANRERKMPKNYITRDKFFITPACRRYLSPLVSGESPPPYHNGLPKFAQLKNRPAKQKLPPWREA